MPVSASSQQEFSDADWRAVSSGDQSKKLKFLLSAISANTTRVWTVPDADVTISSFVATLLDDADAAAARATLGTVSTFGMSIADDAVADLGHLSNSSSTILKVSTSSGESFEVRIRTTSSPICATTGIGTFTNVAVTTSDVTGTTGADGKVTISATDGHLKIENRLGTAVTFRVLVIGG